MALRIRKNGDIVSAKHYKAEEGDIYINDSVQEWLCGANEHSPFKDNPVLEYFEQDHIWKPIAINKFINK